MKNVLFDDERIHGGCRRLRSALSGCIVDVADENVATRILKAPIQRGDSRTMVKGKRQSERTSNSSLITELDAVIALLRRARALASSNDTSTKVVNPTSTGKIANQTLSTEARRAIGAVQGCAGQKSGCDSIATMLDRLLHHAEVTVIEGSSYRVRESEQEATARRRRKK